MGNRFNITKIDNKLPVSETNFESKRPVILFSYFNGNSIRINGFNNCYKDNKSSIKSVHAFIAKIKELQGKTISELFNSKLSRQLHCHPIRESKPINRIKKILKIGYNFSDNVLESFEDNYYEFALDNGERVIFVKVDNIFELLFIDNNHMVYKESSRLLKNKQLYECPSCFGVINFADEPQEYNTKEILKLVIKDYEDGNISDLDEFVTVLKELLEEKGELESISN